jgi:hypothetical protein
VQLRIGLAGAAGGTLSSPPSSDSLRRCEDVAPPPQSLSGIRVACSMTSVATSSNAFTLYLSGSAAEAPILAPADTDSAGIARSSVSGLAPFSDLTLTGLQGSR